MSEPAELPAHLAHQARALLEHLPPGELPPDLLYRDHAGRLELTRRVGDCEDLFCMAPQPGDEGPTAMRLRWWLHEPPVLTATYWRHREVVGGVTLPYLAPSRN